MTIPSYQLLASNKHSSLSVHKNYHVLMVQSTNIASSYILVPIPSLPSPRRQNATVLFVRCEMQVSQSETLQSTSQTTPPRKTPRETASHVAQYYTAPIQNATFKANHIHRSVICSGHSQILLTPTFLHPSKCQSQ